MTWGCICDVCGSPYVSDEWGRFVCPRCVDGVYRTVTLQRAQAQWSRVQREIRGAA